MKIHIISILLACCAIQLMGQKLKPEVIGSGGASGPGWSFTMGQTVAGNSKSKGVVLTQGYQQSNTSFLSNAQDCVSPDDLPCYNIGNIAPQSLYPGAALSFYVWSKELGIKAKRSFKVLAPKAAGKMSLNTQTGRFTFTPAASDKGKYLVIFQAVLNKDTSWQEVDFTVMPKLPSEQIAFGLEPQQPLPRTDEEEFFVLNTANDKFESFNHTNRQTITISVAGKTLIFDKNLDNKLQLYAKELRNDVKELNIYAETVIIRSAIRFPQTQVSIYARNFYFEDASIELASINTMPLPPTPDPMSNANMAGLRAGNITLYVQHFKANPGNRFRLIGGKGQNSLNSRGTNGGNGGTFKATLDLSAYSDLAGGEAGSGPNGQFGNKGGEGSFVTISQKYTWLHPYALKMVVAHAKKAYLNGHMQFTAAVFEDYTQHLEAYKRSTEWLTLSQEDRYELDQLQQEMRTLLHRIGSNFDYFGNPAGWVPMLSFEVNKSAFEQEINRSLRILYFCYWVQRINANNDQKKSALLESKKAQQELLVELQNRYNEGVLSLPQLEAEATVIASAMDSITTILEKLEVELAERAKFIVEERHQPPKTSKWRKIARIAGSVLQVVPVYQPALGIIGTGITTIANIDLNDPMGAIRSAGSAIQSFRSVDFSQSVKNFKAQLAAVDLKNLNPSNLKNVYANLRPKADSIYSAVTLLRQKVGETKVPLQEIQAELDRLKAESPEMAQVLNQVNDLMLKKAQFEQNIAQTIQNIASLTSDIQGGILAIDGLNLKAFELDSKHDLRAVLYVKDMERRAKERLIKYHYYLAKAFEYRLLEPYTIELDLPALFDRYVKMVQQENKGNIILLSEDELKPIRAIYDEALAQVTDRILTIYNQNAPDRVAPIRFDFPDEDIAALNAGKTVVLNLVERNMFFPNEEDIRITGMKILKIEAHLEGGKPGSFARFDLSMEHSGYSKLKKNGQVYHFNHYNQHNRNPLIWSAKYDARDGMIDPVVPSPSAESMLFSLLEKLKKSSSENLVLYSRPAAWADILVSKRDLTATGAKIIVDKITCEVTYDFKQVSNKLVSVDVATDSDLLPYIEVSKADQNERKDGYGQFFRSYFRNPYDSLTLKAPADYGIWKFEGWKDRNGKTIGKNPSLKLSLNADQMAIAHYQKIEPELHVPEKTIYLSALGGTEQVRVENIGNGNMYWKVIGAKNWLSLDKDSTGVNSGNFSLNYRGNPSLSNRSQKIVVVAPNSMDYRDTITIVQGFIERTKGNYPISKQPEIFPNPSSGLVQVNIDGLPEGGGLLKIFNVLGVMVKQVRIQDSSTVLHLQDLSKGVYFIDIRMGNQQFSQKLVLE